MKMLKTIVVLLLTASFLVEDILVLVLPVDQIFFCQEEDGKIGDEDGVEKKESINKDELKSFYRIVSDFAGFTVKTSLKSSREKLYEEHFLEIYTPPPDLA
jgi:hypothetical protein